MMFYIGCPMWGYKEWVGNFLPVHTPASDFLKQYSRRLNVVEGNTTFYSLPNADTIARWRDETPADFRFCPKLSREISHLLPLDTHHREVQEFTERMRGLQDRLGPIFLQMSPNFAPAHLEQLHSFLEVWPSDLRLAVEVRHSDFFLEGHESALNTLLQTYNVARVMMDIRPIQIGSPEEQKTNQTRERKPLLPLHPVATTDFIFLRYISHPRMEVNEPLLKIWAHQLSKWMEEGITPYVFCHCPFEIHSPTVCARFYELVSELTPLPPLSWQPQPRIEQGRLFD